MKNHRSWSWGVACVMPWAMLGLWGCSGSIQTPRMETVASKTDSHGHPVYEGVSQEALPELAEGCVHAWRTALNHNQKAAMSELATLEKRYPGSTTVHFMMGEVLDYGGNKQEAIKFYREAVNRSNRNSMYIFKLAESLRTAGDTTEAIPQYRKLIILTPHFAPARLGLARALLKVNPKSEEATNQVKVVLQDEPANQEAKDMAARLGIGLNH